jgi:uncharacterized protein YndB with AHSA1/START domain
MSVDSYTVQRSLAVDAPPERIYHHIANFHDWTRWSPWEGLDPALRRTYSGAPSGTGAVYAWSGNRRAGQGRMEITDTSKPSTVKIAVAFEKPWKSRSDTSFQISPEGTGSRVTRTMTGKHSLMTKVMSVVRSMDKLIGADFEKGLQRLKATAESSS